MKKKYTIFGHTGFLGKNIIDYLDKKNASYFLPKRNKNIFKKNLNNIIYCIGTDDVHNNIVQSVESNLKKLCEIIENNKFKSFLFISSTRVYLGSKKTKENDNIIINSNLKTYLFNLLKLTSENFCLSQKNKKIKVVRLSNLYGKHFKNQIYLLPTLLRESKQKKRISININKNSRKNYLSVEDAILVIFKIINKSKYKVYNVASDKSYSLKFIANNIQKSTGCKIVYKNQGITYNEPKIDISRIKKEFKFYSKDNFKKFLLKLQ